MSWDEEDTGLPPAVGHSHPCIRPALHILLTRGSFGAGESHIEKDSKVIYMYFTQIFLLYFTTLRHPFFTSVECRIEHMYSTRMP